MSARRIILRAQYLSWLRGRSDKALWPFGRWMREKRSAP
jgi:hypothetical protein